MARLAVVGASGFVGSAVVDSLLARGHEVIPVKSPRVRTSAATAQEVYVCADEHAGAVDRMSNEMLRCTAVVNAGGLATAAAAGGTDLAGANALMPELVSRAAGQAGASRLVHVSSAAVQGRTRVLDETQRVSPFSPYSASKALGEMTLTGRHGGIPVVVYRPTSVHGPGRPATRGLAKLARSPFSSVAGPGNSPTPQVLIHNVADACAFLATTDLTPPTVVLHPWEGITTRTLLELLGAGRSPRHLPASAARVAVELAFRASRAAPSLHGHCRRVELLWFGQAQDGSWLERAGWRPPGESRAWEELARDVEA